MNATQMHMHALAAFGGYGVEIEYMIVDRVSLDVRPIADELLCEAAGHATARVERGAMGWSNELVRHVLEIKNCHPEPQLAPLVERFQAEVRTVNSLLDPLSAQLMPGGMHPWMNPEDEARLWIRDYAEIYRAYDRLFDCRRHGWANLQSVHLNLPFDGNEEFARLHAAIRLVLPILPALAASSPIADGRATGFMDYRMEVYRTHQDRIPASMGEVIPQPSASPAEYRAQVLTPMYREVADTLDPFGESLGRGGSVLQHEWLNARAATPRFERNAIEIRVLDVQECPVADLAIAAATAAVVRSLYRRGLQWLEHEAAVDTAALVRILHACIRDAELAVLDDPRYLALLGLRRERCEAGELWAALVDRLAADGLLAREWLDPLGLIREQGPLSRRLLTALGPNPGQKQLCEVYSELCRCLHEGRMYQPQTTKA